MKKAATLKILVFYTLFIFLMQAAAAFMPQRASALYLSFAIILMGLAAILAQKIFNRQKFLDMGFRLNKNALTGAGIGLVYTAFILIADYWLAQRMGLVAFKENPVFFQGGSLSRVPPLVTALIVGVLGGIPLFISCLFGEELVFRGYILPKLEEVAGPLKAVVFCAVIFALWHIPAYFSLYHGGALKDGPGALLVMLLAHAITTTPLSILYLRTRELYGVSLIHAILDVFQYAIVANPALGEASKSAMYNMAVLNNGGFEFFGWTVSVLSLFVMLWLCKLSTK